MYDVVIAGSGLGGLQCAYILSKEGYNVCVLEKHHQLGGCLQTFVRNNCIFDTGMHYVGALDEGQMLWRFFKYFGLLDKVKMRQLDKDVFDMLDINGRTYKYAQGYDRFVDSLLEQFPNEKKALNEFVAMLKNIADATELFINKPSQAFDDKPTLKYFERNAFDFIKSITDNNELQQVLSGANTLHFHKSAKAPLYVHMVILNSLVESAWRFVDGGHQIADVLADEIQKHGGTIRKSAEVEEFIMNSSDTAIEAVRLKNGERLHAKKFISDIHPVKTFELIESKLIRKVFTNRINDIEQTIGVFSLYVVLEKNSFPYLNYNYFNCDNDNIWVADLYKKVEWPSGYMLFTPATSHTDKYADCLMAITFMDYNDLKPWENTTVEKRGDAYKAYKKEKAEILINFIEKKYPGFRKKIKKYYTSTPLTYRDYTATHQGAIYGNMRDCNNTLKTMLPVRSKVPNLYLTGQNINLHGVLGVSMGSLITSAHFVGAKYLFDKVNNV